MLNIIRKMQIKSKIKCHSTHNRMAKIKKTIGNGEDIEQELSYTGGRNVK